MAVCGGVHFQIVRNLENLVNGVIKQPSVRSGSFQDQSSADYPTDTLNVRTDIPIRGTNDVRARIACALSADAQSITVDRYGYNTSRLAACCTANWEGKRVFAKILFADPYPVPPRFVAPWEMHRWAPVPVRAITEQIDAEWNMTLKMRMFSGGQSVPAPLGKSHPARTIVWEEAGGMSLIRALKWSRWRRSMQQAGEQALFQAGAWLRSIHKASRRGTELVEARDLIRTVSGLARERGQAAWRYEKTAAAILEASLREMGETGRFSVPVALTHGDFCLANLLWDSEEKQLAVIDFELSAFRPICYDLFTLVADLKSELLNPLIPKSVIQSWEEAFWRGYGSVSREIAAFVRALALARIFYYSFSRLLTRRERKGLVGGISAQLYRTFLEDTIISQRLDLPPDLTPSNHD